MVCETIFPIIKVKNFRTDGLRSTEEEVTEAIRGNVITQFSFAAFALLKKINYTRKCQYAPHILTIQQRQNSQNTRASLVFLTFIKTEN